ncbi:MAG: SOS response-associated peptidase [Bacteroidales bacterium]|nr:SOS response-associated peptidase [Bacteroidales bacterium]
MCYTIEINLTREQLEKRFRARLDEHLPYRKQNRVNAFSLPQCPVICTDNPKEIRLYTWGLIPSWSKDKEFAGEIRLKTFNAKSETLDEKPSFRHLVKGKRCLVLTNGFYEWQTLGKLKQPYFIGVKHEEAFALAGLYDSWTDRSSGEIIETFTVITTPANPLMEEIHNTKKRMPLILEKKSEEKWIDPSVPLEKLTDFFRPFNQEAMYAEKVDKELFRTSKDVDPDQKKLF